MTIGVFFGGKSPEHDVSIITGEFIISELKKSGRGVMPVYLSKDGSWYLDEKIGSLKFFQAADKESQLKQFGSWQLDMEASKGKLVFKSKGLLSKKTIEIDLAFPAFHGMNGEDGTIQGLFEMFNLPYVGCDVASSAIAMDKILTKLMYQSQQIATTEFVFFITKQWEQEKDNILAKIKEKLVYPMFVKPPKLGSSIGIAKVKDDNELEFAIEVALHYGERVLVEQGVSNLKDLTCGVLGNDELTPSLVQESAFGGEFFDYEEKYLKDGGAQLGKAEKSLIIPANISDELTKQVQELAMKIYRLVGCSGNARVDLLYDTESKQLYANEINTLPGTLYHHLWKASGIEFRQLVETLIDLAQKKHAKKNKYQYSFESDILKQANSIKLNLKK